MITNDSTVIDAPAGRQEVVISRTFDAPRELVFRCLTEPDLIVRWWGPRYLTTAIDRMEATPGGSWRFIQTAPDGGEHAFHGVYHAVTAPERVVQTFEYEGAAGHVSLDTTVLEDLGEGRTRMVQTAVFQSPADRDAMVASGMERGVRDGNLRLDELLAQLGTPNYS
jgi:uncharacterized protein YndB with AHSA1/START domain